MRFFYHPIEFRLLRWYYSFSITTKSEGKYKFYAIDFLPLYILEKIIVRIVAHILKTW
jgi:hypothetical protein